eukprot:gene9860-6932_t
MTREREELCRCHSSQISSSKWIVSLGVGPTQPNNRGPSRDKKNNNNNFVRRSQLDGESHNKRILRLLSSLSLSLCGFVKATTLALLRSTRDITSIINSRAPRKLTPDLVEDPLSGSVTLIQLPGYDGCCVNPEFEYKALKQTCSLESTWDRGRQAKIIDKKSVTNDFDVESARTEKVATNLLRARSPLPRRAVEVGLKQGFDKILIDPTINILHGERNTNRKGGSTTVFH